ncbi:MAG: hypothetical protein MUE48_13095 [Desulfobacterales bacterium]|nr:hypothetical protein [Desulfobacterales bacterium]
MVYGRTDEKGGDIELAVAVVPATEAIRTRSAGVSKRRCARSTGGCRPSSASTT